MLLGRLRKGKDSLHASIKFFLTKGHRRFPVVAGLRVTWDSRKPPGQRVLNVALEIQRRRNSAAGDSTPNLSVEYEEVKREKGPRKYTVITREYMTQGHDGFECLVGHKMLIDDEQGQMMSTIVRRYLLGEIAFSSGCPLRY